MDRYSEMPKRNDFRTFDEKMELGLHNFRDYKNRLDMERLCTDQHSCTVHSDAQKVFVLDEQYAVADTSEIGLQQERIKTAIEVTR